MSPTEEAHVRRMNRVGLAAFWAHVPLFLLVAWLCDTGVELALLLSLLTLFGPTLAYLRLEDPRQVAHVFAFTSMCLGGLLVHFGQGPMQIEMHFYFFILIALLACYGNPAVNLTAAATAIVHHATLWLLLPSSLFNYEASIWVVMVHGAFVLADTGAAVFIARTFYENVIGLEGIVARRTAELEARNRDMRRVLDHVGQGMLTVDAAGRVSNERSKKLDQWLGELPASGRFSDWLERFDRPTAEWFEIGLEELVDAFLPRRVLVKELPRQFRRTLDGERHTYALEYAVIEDEEGEFERLLVVMTDVTDALRRAESEAQQKENLRLFELLASDATGFEEYFEEAKRMVRAVVDEPALPLTNLERLLHTLKGNSALFGLERIVQRVHEIEQAIADSGDRPKPEVLQSLDLLWSSVEQKVAHLSGGARAHQLTLERSDFAALCEAVDAERPHAELGLRLRKMQMEPSARRLAILAEQAQRIAERLGRDNVDVHAHVEADVRFENARWAGFWASLVHVFRNAIDHGLEREDERIECGKDSKARLALRTYSRGDELVVEIEDDGRGIDLERLAARARSVGLPAKNTADVLAAVFSDGVTTRDEVTEISGRGVGMAAVRAEAEALGGTVSIATERGRGTCLAFKFPMGEIVLPETTVAAGD